MPGKGEASGIADLLRLISPQFTDEEQLGSEAMQQDFESLHRKLHETGRIVLTWHGRPKAVVLSYQNMKKLWALISEVAENRELVSLMQTRATSPSATRVDFEEGLTRIKEKWISRSDES